MESVFGEFKELDSTSGEGETGDFECNICFDIAQDPIVTLCGHLYCWPCLYSWLRVHSHSHECPVCKAIIQQEKLIPIYGRGKASSDPRSRAIPGIDIPNRPAGQRPQTAPAPNINYLRQDELGHMAGFNAMANERFGNLTLSALFGAIPSFFNLQVQGFHDATVYGATTGVPFRFSNFHGGYAHGFHQHTIQAEGIRYVMKMCLLILGLLVVIHLIS